MLTLSDASYDTKEILKWGGLCIAGLVIVVSLLLFIKQTFFPTPPPKPTLAFGKLTPQLFPKNVSDKTYTYTINTLSGTLPSFPDQAKVYKMQINTPDLLGLSNAKQIAQGAGFTDGPNKISETSYQWINSNNTTLQTKIDINIVNYNFNVTSDYLNNSAVFSGQQLQPPTESVSDAQGILTALNSFPQDIDQTKTQTKLLSIQNGALTTATSLSSAQVARVIFYQQDVNKLPVYYERPDASNIDVLVGPGDKILAANYVHQNITDQSATYPLKTTDQAFDALRQGYAYIASYQGSSSNISITDVRLGYYIEGQPQAYLMPIMVFTGSDNFVAYVPAVTDEWIGK
jgi:hypothetical protein